MRVALLGLGQMGAAMARRLEQADLELVVFNRSPRATEEFAARGVQVARTPGQAAAGADVCLSMLADGPAVEAVLFGEAGVLADHVGGSRPVILIEMSTIDVTTSERIAVRAEALGVRYLRAPVSGNPSVVEAGNLAILVSGESGAVNEARPVLAAIGPKLFHLGDREEARVMKLALNLMIAGTAEMLAEALTMGEAAGLDRGKMLDVIAGSAVGSPFVSYKAAALVADDYGSTFSSLLMSKDLRLVVECANAAGVPVPLASLVQQLLQGCIGSGMADLDFMTLLPRLQREAGQRTELPAHAA